MYRQADCPQSPFQQSDSLFKHTSSIHLMQPYQVDSPERNQLVTSRTVHSTAHMDYRNDLLNYPRPTLNSQLFIRGSPQQSNPPYDSQINNGNSSSHNGGKPPSIQFIVNEYERTHLSETINMSNMPSKFDDILVNRTPITSQLFKTNLLTNEAVRPIYVTQQIGDETLRNLQMKYEVESKPFAKNKAEPIIQQNLPETYLKSRQSSKIQQQLVYQSIHLQQKLSKLKKSNAKLSKLSELVSQISSNSHIQHTLRIYQQDRGGLDYNLLKKYIQKTIISNEK